MILFYYLVTQLPLDQDPTWGKFVGAATMIKYLGLICVFYAVLHLTARRSWPRFLQTIQARLFFVYLTLAFFSYLFMGPEFSMRASPIISLLSMAFLFFVVLSVVDSLSRLRWTLLATIASMGWTSLFVLREWIRDPGSRPGWVAGDANYFALDACLVLPLALLFAWHSRILWERVFAFGCFSMTLAATLVGASRGGLLGLVASSIWFIWHSPRRIRNLVLLLILMIPPLVLLPSSPLRRFIHPQYSDLAGERDRPIAWRAGLRMVERHPIMGIGLGEFKPQMLKYADPGVGFSSIAHNTYLEVAAETGLPNFLVFLGMLSFTYIGLGRIRRLASDSGPPLTYLASMGTQAGFVGFLVCAFFLSAEYMKLFWLCTFLSMVLPSFVTERDRKGNRGKETLPRQTQVVTETLPRAMT